jgi:hypothetical protein
MSVSKSKTCKRGYVKFETLFGKNRSKRESKSSIKTISRFKKRFGYIIFQCESLGGTLSLKFETYVHQMIVFRRGY